MENLARYIIRASFSQERMAYLRDESKVLYQSKEGNKSFEYREKGFEQKPVKSYLLIYPLLSVG